MATVVGGVLSNLAANGDGVCIWILDCGLEPAARTRIEAVLRLHARLDPQLRWVPIRPSDLRDLGPVEHLPAATYARLLLPTLLPADLERVVCIDSDVVIRGDVTPLSSVPLQDAALAAVQDFVVETVGSDRTGLGPIAHRAGKSKYFNAGVIVLNLPVWRSRGLSERVLSFAQEHAPLRYADQDALNAVIEDWREIGPEWNLQSRIFWLDRAADSELIKVLRRSRETLLANARIFHFSGPSKPWEPFDRHPLAGLWPRALRASGCLTARELWQWGSGYYPQRAVARTAISARRALAGPVAR